MTEKYEFQRTSLRSATGSDKVLAETATTRLLLRYIFVENQKNPDAKVKIAIVHQRKSLKGTWEDAPAKPLSSLKAEEQFKLILHSETTLELYHQLQNLYAIPKDKIGYGKTSLVVAREEEIIQTDIGRAKVIKLLLAGGYSDDLWNELVQANPNLATPTFLCTDSCSKKVSP